MAKQLVITDPKSGEKYTLEYTRATVSMMEKQGFVADELTSKLATMIPALFAGAFLAHHRKVKRETVERIYELMPNKDKLLEALITMYQEPINALLEDPEGDEGNMNWTVNW